MTYPDTSFLFSLYVQEQTSSVVKSYMAAHGGPLAFTPFHRLELRTALRLRAFQGFIDRSSLSAALRQSMDDVTGGILEHTALNWSKALRKAEEIASVHLTKVGARSGDLLHVASAVILEADDFLTFDQRQATLARRAGLTVRSWAVA